MILTVHGGYPFLVSSGNSLLKRKKVTINFPRKNSWGQGELLGSKESIDTHVGAQKECPNLKE